VLSLIARPLTVPILRGHLDGPLRLPDLRERFSDVKRTTLRTQVDKLRGIGALERHVLARMPYTVENELTDAGREILAVADSVAAWLARAPHGPIALGSEEAKAAIKALVDAWDSTMLDALVERPMSLTELDNRIGEHTYPALDRRLSAMRAAGLVEPRPKGAGEATPYAVTEWARQGSGLLLADTPPPATQGPSRTDSRNAQKRAFAKDDFREFQQKPARTIHALRQI
jgi:DNA-binding HxlR family transcriptional regulator